MDQGRSQPRRLHPGRIPAALRAVKTGARNVLNAYAIRKSPQLETFAARVIRETANHRRVLQLQNEFFPSDTGLRGEENWHAVRQLGAGGQGMAGLWVQVDPKTRKIVDRMVIKEAQPADVEWLAQYNWLGGRVGGIPREAGIPLLMQQENSRYADRVVALYTPKLTQALNALSRVARSIAAIGPELVAASNMIAFDPAISLDAGHLAHDIDVPTMGGAIDRAAGTDSDLHPDAAANDATPSTPSQPIAIADDNCIVRIRSYGIQPQRMTYRVYMDFLSAGDLCPLILTYADKSTGGHTELVPEPFIWFTLYRLMMACKAMERVERLESLLEAGVVHQDIKPANVFLAAPDDTHYPYWPRAYLGDFGSAHLVTSATTDTANDWRNMDFFTPGWMPPEYQPAGDVVTPAANVWVSAFVILSLMERDDMYFDLYGTQESEISPAVERLYSAELIQTIRDCMEIQPELRPRPQAVLDFINANSDRLLDGMRDPRAAGRKKENHLLPGAVDANKDRYREGFHYPPELLDFIKTTGRPYRAVSADWDLARKPKLAFLSHGGT